MIARPELPAWLTAFLAIVAGLLIGAGQAPLGLWPATMVGLAMYTWLLQHRSKRGAAGYGYLAGLAMNTLTISWISVLGIPVAVGLIAYVSLWFALAGLLISWFVRLPYWPVWVAFTWVAVEFVSGKWPFGGFSWNRLGFTVVDQPMAGLLPYIGAAGATLIVAWTSQLLLSLRRLYALATIGITVALGGFLLFAAQPAYPEQRINVAVIQPGVNRHEYGSSFYARAVTNNALSATVMAIADARVGEDSLDFVLWPESATDYDPLRDEEAQRKVQLAARLADVPVLVGAVTLPDDPPDSRQTSGIWWDPVDGPIDVYHKRNLVPFGEWIPFRDVLLQLVPMLEQTGRQSVPGDKPGVLHAPTERYPSLLVGDVICFELAYDDTVYDVVREGANVIVSQSNENTYAGTWQVAQQQRMNRVRSLELQREILVSTLNSISGVTDTNGQFRESTKEFEGNARILQVPLRYQVSPAVTVGPFLSRASTVAVLGVIGWLITARLRAGARLDRTGSRKVPHGE